MFPSRFLAQVAVSLVLILRVNAETHVIKFVNQCGHGSPALMYNGLNILTGDTYTSNGPYSGIAYLQTGHCNVNGENCTLLETTLINPTCAGCGSSTDLSLIPPHAYSVETSFAYYNGCDGQGHTCSSSSCTSAAFFAPNDNFVQVGCEINNVNLLVAFCADASQLVTGNVAPVIPTATSGSSSPMSSLPTPSSTPSLGPSSSVSTTPLSTPSGSSSPTSSLPTPSSSPSLGPSSPVSTTPLSTPSGGSPPTSSLPTPSSATSLGPSSPGSTTPSTTPSSTPTPTPTPTNVSDSGCDETGSTTPSSTSTPTPTPTATPSGSNISPLSTPTSTPTPTPTSTPTPTPTIPTNLAPVLPSASPTTSRRCRPRPTSLTPSISAPSSPMTTPVSPPTFTPSTTPAISSISAGTGTTDPCGDISGTSASTPSAQRRRHRRTSRIHP